MRYFRQITIYIVLFICAYLCINYTLFRMFEYGIWHPFNSKAIVEGAGGSGHSLQRYHDWEQTAQASVVFAGSSHTYRSINCNLSGLQLNSGFNWGSTSQTPLNTYYLLQSLDLNSKQTQVLVLDLFYRLMSDKHGTEACIDLNTNLPLNSYALRMNFASEDLLAVNHLLAIACDRFWRLHEEFVQQVIPCDEYKGKGYVQRCDSSFSKPEHIRHEALNGQNLNLSERQMHYLKECTLWLRSQGIRVIWSSQPLPELLRKHDPSYAIIQSGLHKLAEELQVEFWDYSADNGAWSFFDWHHLNDPSADRYTRIIYSRLIRRF